MSIIMKKKKIKIALVTICFSQNGGSGTKQVQPEK
jgi:hypothetical protein